jgi:adenosine kinase
MSVIVTGSIAYDYIMDFAGDFTDHILKGETRQINTSFVIDDLQRHFGGCSLNIAHSLDLLGIKSKVIGIAGSDFGDYQYYLKAKGKINTESIVIDENTPTAAAYINSDLKGNQIVAFYPGASAKPYSFPKLKNMAEVKLAIVSPENKLAMLNNLEELHKLGVRTIFDPGQMTPYFDLQEWQSILGMIDILVVNNYEYKIILGNLGIKKTELEERVATIIVTKGENGSVITANGEEFSVDAVKTDDVVDTTGAGDAYRAGLIAGILEDKKWHQVGQLASTAAVYAVEERGTQVHNYTVSQFQKRYKQNFT